MSNSSSWSWKAASSITIVPWRPRRLEGRLVRATIRKPEAGKRIVKVLMFLSASSSSQKPSSISEAAWLKARAHIAHAWMYSMVMSWLYAM